jgi:sarcosine oxidase subunit beta
VPGADGLYVAAGFSGHGFMVAPAVGRLLAAVVAGEEPDELVAALSPSRFEEGRLCPEAEVV